MYIWPSLGVAPPTPLDNGYVHQSRGSSLLEDKKETSKDNSNHQ